MKKNLFIGFLCVTAGFVAGQFCPPVLYRPAPPLPPALLLSSEGRQALSVMHQKLYEELRYSAGNIVSEEIQALQAMVPLDTETAESHLLKAVQKKVKIQLEANKILLKALNSMPPNDRRLYLKAYVSDKQAISEEMIFKPLKGLSASENDFSLKNKKKE